MMAAPPSPDKKKRGGTVSSNVISCRELWWASAPSSRGCVCSWPSSVMLLPAAPPHAWPRWRRLPAADRRCRPLLPPARRALQKFARLPALDAAAEQLAFRLGFSAKLGRHAVAEKDLPAGTLILLERPVVAIPRSK